MPKWGKVAAVAAEKHRIYGKQTWHWGHSTTFITIDLLKVVMFRVKILWPNFVLDIAQMLVEGPPKGQLLKTAGQVDTLKAGIVLKSEGQALKLAWQHHIPQALPEMISKGQGFKAAWQRHAHQGRIKILAKGQM
jgi:hypothetical protein